MANQTSVIGSKSDTTYRAEGFIKQFLLYLVLIIGAALAILPFYWMLSTSLMTLGETINKQWIPSVPQFVNYTNAWREANFSLYFINSVYMTVVTVLGVTLTSVLAGYAFARIQFKGRDVLFALLLATLMIPESVTMIPNFLMIRGEIIPWGSWLNTLRAITLPYMASAFSIFLLKQFFATVPYELWDAARIDGAGHFRFLFQIVLPISKAPIMTVVLLSFIGAWNAFLWPLLVTTSAEWRPLMVGLYTFITEAGPETHLLMAGAAIALAPVLLLYFFTQKQFTEGIATTGLKG